VGRSYRQPKFDETSFLCVRLITRSGPLSFQPRSLSSQFMTVFHSTLSRSTFSPKVNEYLPSYSSTALQPWTPGIQPTWREQDPKLPSASQATHLHNLNGHSIRQRSYYRQMGQKSFENTLQKTGMPRNRKLRGYIPTILWRV
jgi:hypothetical protein